MENSGGRGPAAAGLPNTRQKQLKLTKVSHICNRDVAFCTRRTVNLSCWECFFGRAMAKSYESHSPGSFRFRANDKLLSR